MRGLVGLKRTTGIEDNVLLLFTVKLDFVANRRPSPLNELSPFLTAFLLGKDVT